MQSLNPRGYGYYRAYDIAQINAGVTAEQSDMDGDLNLIGYVNVISILNKDAVEYEIYINGDTNKKIIVPAQVGSTPTLMNINGTFIEKIQIKNTDGSTNGTANALVVSLLKQYGDIEKAMNIIPE